MSSPSSHIPVPPHVEAIAELFTSLADETLSGCIRDDLADLSREELIREFRQARDVLSGLVVAAENINRATFTVLSDATRRAEEALERAEG